MREIEFNVWDSATNTMLTEKDELRFKIYLDGGCSIDGAWCTKDVELLQYIGIKDCDGDKIFEGDILAKNEALPRVVIFEEAAFRLEDQGNHQNQSIVKFTASKLKIIGNKYENPELLQDES